MFNNTASRLVNFANRQAKGARGGALYSAEEMVRAALSPRQARHHMKKAGIGLAKGAKLGWEWGFKGAPAMALPFAAFSAASAERGHKAAAGIGAMTPWLGTAIGGFLAGAPGAILGGILIDGKLQEMVTDGVQLMIDTGQQLKAVEMGKDNAQLVQTQAAYTMRQRAARDLSGSLLNARQYLGKEAALLHS